MKNELKFEKKDTNTEFWTNNDVDLKKLEGEIKIAIDVKKWEDCEDKDGLSGLSMVEWEDSKKYNKIAKRKIVIHWTNDGVNGFDVSFPDNYVKIVKKTIKDHVK